MGLFGAIGAWLAGGRINRRSQAIGAFRETVMAAVRAHPAFEDVTPDADDPAAFTAVNSRGSLSANVTNLFGYLSYYPEEDADEAIARFLSALDEDPEAPVSDDDIVPVLRNRAYIEAVIEGRFPPLHEPAGADLMTVYMVDRPSALGPLTAEDAAEKSLEDVREIALANLEKWLPKVVAESPSSGFVLYYVDGNPLLSTGLVLLDAFWASIAARFPGDVLIVMPRRDQLFIFDDDGGPLSKAQARKMIDLTYEDDFNLMSPRLYARRDGRIVEVTD